MPNWCNNDLKITGKNAELKKLLKYIKGKDETGEELVFDFEKVSPTPKELMKHSAPLRDRKLVEKFIKKYGAEDWWYWRINNWGTKWNLGADQTIEVEDGCISMSFDTAWSPPVGIIEKLGEKFPKLSFELIYCEVGMCFAGKYIVAKENELYEYDESNPEYKKILEHFGFEEEIC